MFAATEESLGRCSDPSLRPGRYVSFCQANFQTSCRQHPKLMDDWFQYNSDQWRTCQRTLSRQEESGKPRHHLLSVRFTPKDLSQ